MATFFDGNQLGSWGANPMYGRLTGDVSRSGNTVTLYNLHMELWAASAWGSDGNAWMTLRDGGNELTRHSGLSFSGGSGNFNFNNVSIGVGTTDTSHTFNVTTNDGFTVYFTAYFPSGWTPTNPSGLSVSVAGRTYNSFTLNGSIGSWGEHQGANQAFCLGILGSGVTRWEGGRLEWQNLNPGENRSYSGTVGNSSVAYDGGLTIKGCGAYKMGLYVRNGSGWDNSTVNGTVLYTPPAPLASATATAGSYIINERKFYVAIAATGGSSSVNNNVNVNTYYRYKTSGSSTWGSWTLLGTGTPWTKKSTTLKLNASTTYNFQFYQVYQNQGSAVYSVSVTTPATPDVAILYVPVNGKSKKLTKLYFSLNGVSKKLTKLYASVNGVAKRIF